MHRHVSVNTSLLGPEEAPMPCQPWPIWPRRERKLPSFTQNGDTLLKAKEMRGFWMFFHVPGFASRCVNSMALWVNPLPGEDVCVSVQVPGQQAQVFQLLQAPVVFGPDPTPDPTLGQRTGGQRSVIGGGRLGGVADAVSDPEHAALQQPPGGRWPHGPELGGWPCCSRNHRMLLQVSTSTILQKLPLAFNKQAMLGVILVQIRRFTSEAAQVIQVNQITSRCSPGVLQEPSRLPHSLRQQQGVGKIPGVLVRRCRGARAVEPLGGLACSAGCRSVA